MVETAPKVSVRRDELLERAYSYVLEQGLSGLSLRPLAAAIQSSPRVLLFLFGSKDGLIGALLARARADELRLLDELRAGERDVELAEAAGAIWDWLAAVPRRPLLRLWADAYGQSLIRPDGPWRGFARATVEDWLALLATTQPTGVRDSPAAAAERTLVLAVLRGALLDLLATGDAERAGAAVQRHLAALGRCRPVRPGGDTG